MSQLLIGIVYECAKEKEAVSFYELVKKRLIVCMPNSEFQLNINIKYWKFEECYELRFTLINNNMDERDMFLKTISSLADRWYVEEFSAVWNKELSGAFFDKRVTWANVERKI